MSTYVTPPPVAPVAHPSAPPMQQVKKSHQRPRRQTQPKPRTDTKVWIARSTIVGFAVIFISGVVLSNHQHRERQRDLAMKARVREWKDWIEKHHPSRDELLNQRGNPIAAPGVKPPKEKEPDPPTAVIPPAPVLEGPADKPDPPDPGKSSNTDGDESIPWYHRSHKDIAWNDKEFVVDFGPDQDGLMWINYKVEGLWKLGKLLGKSDTEIKGVIRRMRK